MSEIRLRAAAAVLLLLLVTVSASTSDRRRDLLAAGGKGGKQAAAPKCDEIASSTECAGTKGCRWCRSDAVDDMCFSSAEAWRLPYQVFSCDG